MMLLQTVWFYLVLKTLFTVTVHSFSIETEHSMDLFINLMKWYDHSIICPRRLLKIALILLVQYYRILAISQQINKVLWQLNISSVYVYSCLSLRLSDLLQKVFYLCPINLRFFLLLKLFETKINFLNLKL